MIFSYCPFCHDPVTIKDEGPFLNQFVCRKIDHSFHIKFDSKGRLFYLIVHFTLPQIQYSVYLMDKVSTSIYRDNYHLEPPQEEPISSNHDVNVSWYEFDWSNIESFKSQILTILAFS